MSAALPGACDEREDAFVFEYVWGEHAGVGNLCAQLAGYEGTPASLSTRAWHLRRRPRVAAAIRAQVAEKEALVKSQFLRAAEELFAIGTANLADAFNDDGTVKPLGEMPLELRRAMKSIETEQRYEGAGPGQQQVKVRKLALHDKVSAVEKFLKYAGKLAEKVDVDASGKLADLWLEAARLRESRKKVEKPDGTPDQVQDVVLD